MDLLTNYTQMLATKKDREVLGLEIRKRRIGANMTQVALAKKAGFSNKQLDHIERGVHWPSMEVYIALCRALGVDKIPLVN